MILIFQEKFIVTYLFNIQNTRRDQQKKGGGLLWPKFVVAKFLIKFVVTEGYWVL